MKKKFVVFVVLIGLLTFSAMDTNAAFTTYTSEAAWDAAFASWVTEPFDSGGLQSFTGVTTSAGSIGPAAADGSLSGSVWNDRVTSSGGESTTFSYKPGPFFGAGAIWDTLPSADGQGLNITANFSGGGSQLVSEIDHIHGTFFGFISSQSLDSFTITADSQPGAAAETFDMDNLKFGTAVSAVPEPATILLLGIGLAGLVGIRKKL